MKNVHIFFFILQFSLCGCTAVDVRPVPANQVIKAVSIVKNEKVAVDDFLDVLVAGFERHGIATKVIPEATDSANKYVVTYVAYRNWDMAPYLSNATINIEKDGEQIAHAEYHLKGGGGFSLMKWDSTKTKMDPVIDELLENFNSQP
jgi:hypothetical protein